ncbi:uncharacterized protein TRIADDRAFT_53239 [Trichoplax adhaerens]|uniref:EHMT1/2 cysteine-rich region domain-containing protein n=1 Tax=Trichoplax adhaerens TaxID=10228 RepID=B3RNP4_TRIAD|nr:predicted protein [Trichoplax adhaerens]EDV27494.1 predicted protein [Trichoplax adhaerens]|eukprot:XP_002109328.1 predicted protein [Trichoplax adhaerens]
MDSVPFSVDSSSSSSYHSVHDINDKTMTDAVSKPRPVASGRAGKKRARRRRWSRKPRRTQKVPTVMVNPRFKDVGCQYKQDELVQSNNKWQLEISKHNGSNLYQDDDNFSTREFLCTCNDIIKVVDSNERTTPIICEALLGSANIRCNSVADCSEMKQITHSKTAFLCKEHSVLLKNHRCCPICGIFCQSRDFIHCSREKSHRFHLGCVMNTKCDLKCPHCGEDCKIGLGFNEQKLLSENALDTNTNDTNSTTSSGFCETISGSVCESNSNLSQCM